MAKIFPGRAQFKKFPKKSSVDGNILLQEKEDRRKLSHVPDTRQIRKKLDRRGLVDEDSADINRFIGQKKAGIRYKIDYDITLTYRHRGRKKLCLCKGIDLSATGILVKISDEKTVRELQEADSIRLDFEITPGSMPEGLEMRVKNKARPARTAQSADGGYLCGLAFDINLFEYAARRRGRYMLMTAGLMLFLISAFILLLRAESIIYFKFNKWLYLYSIIAAALLLSRYLFGALYREEPIDPDYTPGVSIIIPCFNEEQWIQRTVLSCINQYYPPENLEVIVVDDCSTDDSPARIKEIVHQLYREAEQFDVPNRLKYILMETNGGKREALIKGVERAKHDLVVFVDSDSFLDPFAIRSLVQPFKDPRMGGVAGRTDVANTYTNALTKMQSVRYYIAFRILKAAESYFDTVTCLSGPLACYRKELVLENREAWLNQSFLGRKATFGDDRAMTNLILRKYRTAYQDSALCYTIVPNDLRVFMRQQMRWKRSWLRESLLAARFMWKKEPFAAVSFYIGLAVPVIAPVVVLYNLVYVPLAHNIFPLTFLVGLLLMSLLMSMAQMLLRRSSTWIYGMVFCLFYVGVLLWQMPIAWVTFWKSTWGTRMTPSDVAAAEKKKQKINKIMALKPAKLGRDYSETTIDHKG